MKVVDLPDINFNTNGDTDLATNRISEFYKALGWNKETHEVDPCKFKLNVKDWDKFIGDFMDNAKDNYSRSHLGMVFISYGPSVEDNVKPGTVRIYKDAFIPNNN